MEAPKCRLCEKRHWGTCNNVSFITPITVLVEDDSPPVVANRVANRHGKYADKEKRRIYQRDLMRKRRASCNPK